MPTIWGDYINLVEKTDTTLKGATEKISMWSNGYRVREPYLSELRTFWTSGRP